MVKTFFLGSIFEPFYFLKLCPIFDELTFLIGIFFKNFLRGMSVCQKLGIILENKVFQKLSLEKNVFTKRWSPNLIFLNEIFFWKNSVDYCHWKLTLKVQFWLFLMNRNSSTDLKKNPLSMLILGQKSCFLGPTIFEIPQPNWY